MSAPGEAVITGVALLLIGFGVWVIYRHRLERLRERAASALAGYRPVAPLPLVTLRLGMTGPHVRYWQEHLRWLGYAVQVDGAFGAETLRATQAFQRRCGLADDGMVGPATWLFGHAPLRPHRRKG